MPDLETGPVKEAVGVFKDAKSLESAVEHLESSGFDRAMISLLAGEAAITEKLGHIYSRVEEIEDNPDVPHKAFVSTQSLGEAEGALIGSLVYVGAVGAIGAVVASGGTLGAAIAGAAAAGGVGGVLGKVLANLVDQRQADYYRRQIERGGILLWVRVAGMEQEQKAQRVLTEHGAADVHVHERHP